MPAAVDMSVPMSMQPQPSPRYASGAMDSASYRRRLAIIGSLSKSIGQSFGAHSFGRSMGSFGKNSFSHLDSYNFQLGSRSPLILSPSRDLAHFAGLEDKFCKDFSCCGTNLENLHELLQHFEECHVRIESDIEDDEDLPFEFESMDEDADMSDDNSPSAPANFNDIFLKSQLQSLSSNQPQAVNLADIYSDDYRITHKSGSAASAFDTSVVQRKRYPHNPTATRVKKVKSMGIQEQHQTIPFSFDGPTPVSGDVDMEDAAPASSPQQAPVAPTPAPPQPPSITNLLSNASSQSPASPTLPLLNVPTTIPNLSELPFDAAAAIAVGAATIGPDGMVIMDDGNSSSSRDDRPYKCQVAGCTKAYKNPGGLKYHMQHGHCEDTGDPEMNNIIHKPYQCTVPDCGKRYKNLNGLKYHIEHAHISLLGPC
ncbi:hypothetical protein HK104_008996 [Borealophlyctis nickersoniae]|nr:hypothetical protein HK104_008996 [Borealophlyctis nickersoniae]